ncbi:MAG: histidine kinase [Sphingomonas bacterium]|uniref:sensor histidine kinase n=1 Tax=Sphingomonas bacterium TaxID=1895847 RepID=UPI0026364EEC|nr:sensor histidine kinase [Sphingomonas bacterium]MDB5708900.1 histidine kinase [Sphingomonas bacterium]
MTLASLWARADRSITARLLRGMVLPMAGLALLLGIGGALAIRGAVETVNDRILGAASRAIAESLTVEDGEIALNLSPAIFGMIEDTERDNVYYSVRQNGRAITGYADLPSIASGMRDTEVRFGDAVYRGRAVRIVSEGRRLSGVAQPVVVEVAETLGTRERIERRLLVGLAALEALLIGLTALLLPLAVRWGIRPLVTLREEMDHRLAVDLTPLSLDGVPVELRDLVAAFNGMLRRLDAALQRMRQFTADASHQLRTPLQILRTHIGVLRVAAPGSAEATGSLADIDQASARLQRLVVQLLNLARADNAAPPVESFAVVDANALAASVAEDHAAEAIARGIELRFERASHAAPIRTQDLLAAELLGNLVDNAIRYNRDGGHVAVSVVRATDGVDILVEDDGPGIPLADRGRVMTRFSRLDRDAPREGSGLGLSIAEALAGALGATLTLDQARSGQGLLVRVRFPAATQE